MTEQTLSYAEVTHKFHGRPTLPVMRHTCDDVHEIYVPDWTPSDVLARMVQHCLQDLRGTRVDVYRVTQCPRTMLFADWAAHMPEEGDDEEP